MAVIECEILNDEPYDPTHDTADDHGRDVDTCRDFDSECDNREERFDDESYDQIPYDRRDLLLRRTKAGTSFSERVARTGKLEQKLRDRQFGETIPVADQPGNKRNKEDFEQGI